ncbi:hypothetical protein BRADI_3g44005v3 [Brachypodium distachyon]|uniref:Uncharacterized protein n=1 Tax=Brachypodium distachyon TaxID=15368 RepID=A0A2K2D320_BRADI|nr:hypothetical protein BRADI_3g44005v3 [Brachypodium distachyon]
MEEKQLRGRRRRRVAKGAAERGGGGTGRRGGCVGRRLRCAEKEQPRVATAKRRRGETADVCRDGDVGERAAMAAACKWGWRGHQ